MSIILAAHAFDYIVHRVKFSLTSCKELPTPLSEHVRLLWCEHFDKELVSKGIEEQAQRLITSESGKICRKCFAIFEQCPALGLYKIEFLNQAPAAVGACLVS